MLVVHERVVQYRAYTKTSKVVVSHAEKTKSRIQLLNNHKKKSAAISWHGGSTLTPCICGRNQPDQLVVKFHTRLQ